MVVYVCFTTLADGAIGNLGPPFVSERAAEAWVDRDANWRSYIPLELIK